MFLSDRNDRYSFFKSQLIFFAKISFNKSTILCEKLSAFPICSAIAFNLPKPELKRIRKVEYDIDPNRYELRSGSETNAPLCPYGNIYKWVVFDLKANEYVRFAKSVFKLLINKNGK